MFAKKKRKERPEKKKAREAIREKRPRSRPPEYILKKNTLMRFLRVVMWAMLLFIFIKGVASCLERDSAQRAEAAIHDFRREFAEYKDDNEEIMGFAQNFAREYLTWENRKENDYAQRIRPYVSQELYSRAADLTDFKGKAAAVYVKAYRKEQYSGEQYDVYVLSDVVYTKESVTVKEGESQKENITQNRTVTLKIPVYRENGKYVVEGIPIIVNDNTGISGYSAPAYTGTAITDGRTGQITEAVVSFLKAYYGQDQNVIEYYLTKDADREKFRGLSGRYTFRELDRISCYDTEAGILCIVEFRVSDEENGYCLLQGMHLTVRPDGDKYYIQDMNTKTGHL